MGSGARRRTLVGLTAPGLLQPTGQSTHLTLDMGVSKLVVSTLLCLSTIIAQSADYDPLYLGKFSNLAHSVDGDIFVLDEKTIYIQAILGNCGKITDRDFLLRTSPTMAKPQMS